MDYLTQHFDRVWPLLIQHVQITGLTLGIALLIALPLGLLVSRVRVLSTPVLGLLGIIYTIPSLALFALMIPFLGLGTTTAVVVLVGYSQFALVRNIAVAFNGLDPTVLEAARGVGMTPRQVLWQVEAPLALPIVLAGVRIATLVIISLATIAAWIGAGGLGFLLLNGVSQNHPSEVIAGVICVTAMALVADLFFRLLERRVGAYRYPARVARRLQPLEEEAVGGVPEHI
jgi:osmoprotectant transport system permease protein